MRDDDFTRDLQPGDTCGPYQIGRLLDEGGFSVVYAGENTIIKRPAALKILKPERDRVEDIVERFAREIELLAKIDHENVVRFYETGYARGRLWLAMELLDGRTLRKHILAGRRFRLEEALRIGYEIACGVAQAQALGVIHRDLKPENVILTEAVVVKVLDFGIAKFNGQGVQSTGRHPLGVMGTPSYMSPEQILGEAVTFASDVYQIAVIIYELVAGQHPFANRRGELPTQTQMCEFHVEFAPRPLTDRGVPGEVWAVIAKGLEKEPRKRWPTVEAFGRALWSALIHLRASLSEQGLPEDHRNPAGADGEAMGSSARRAYQPALTPALEPLPTSASGSVRLRSDLRAMATTTTSATTSTTATTAPGKESAARTGLIEKPAPLGPQGTVRMEPRRRVVQGSPGEVANGGEREEGDRATLPTPKETPRGMAPLWLEPERSSPPSSLEPFATLPRRGTPTARVARELAPMRAATSRSGPPRWLLVVMGCSAMLCLVILGYSLRGSSRPSARASTNATPAEVTAAAPSAVPTLSAAPLATIATPAVTVTAVAAATVMAVPAVTAAPVPAVSRATAPAPVAVPRARRSAPSPSGSGLRPIFRLPAEKTMKDVF